MHNSPDTDKHLLNISSQRYLSKVNRRHMRRVIGISFIFIALFLVCFRDDDVRTIFVNMQAYVMNIGKCPPQKELEEPKNLLLRCKERILDQLLDDNKEISVLKQRLSDYKNAVVGQVLRITVNEYTATIVINVGSDQGVSKDDYIVNESGLIGRISEVTPTWSSATLSTDFNSNIPIKFVSNGNMAIAQGNNHDRMKVTMKNGIFDVIPDDLVVTSGYGGLYLKDIPVGTVDKDSLIRPCFDYKKLRFVCVIGHISY